MCAVCAVMSSCEWTKQQELLDLQLRQEEEERFRYNNMFSIVTSSSSAPVGSTPAVVPQRQQKAAPLTAAVPVEVVGISKGKFLVCPRSPPTPAKYVKD